MAQLVGKNCVICQDRISSVLDAEFCDSCGNPVHSRCLAAYPPPQDQASDRACRRCGGNPEQSPLAGDTDREGAQLEYWLFGIAAVAMLAAIVMLVTAILSVAPDANAEPAADVETVADAGSDAGESPAEVETPGDPGDPGDPAASDSESAVVDAGPNPIVEIETTLGTIRAELFRGRAPRTVENFLDLVEQEYYDGIIFHRVINDFMIQTGDPLGNGTGGRTDKGLPAKSLADEFHPELRHDKPGVLSMANSGPNTGDTQFFITTVPTPWLDDKHAIFGQVVDGMDVVEQIENVATDASDKPVEEVRMVRVRVVEEAS